MLFLRRLNTDTELNIHTSTVYNIYILTAYNVHISTKIHKIRVYARVFNSIYP